MLSSDDRAIVLRDDALPGLATLLDEERLGAALARHVGRSDLERPRVEYLRYKQGTSCLAAFQQVIGGEVYQLHAVTSRNPVKLRLRHGDHLPGGPFGTLGLSLGDVVVRAFPNDPGLKVLHRLLDPGRRAKVLPMEIDRIEPLRYKPERRWVARIDTEDGPAALKVHALNRVAAAIAGARTVVSRGPLIVPGVFHLSAEQGMVVQRWLDGELLSTRQEVPEWDPRATTAVGAALAEAHSQGQLAPGADRAIDERGLTDLGQTLGSLLPGWRQAVRTHAATLVGALHELADIRTTIHGDFYAKQVVLQGGGAGVLDFDQARPGDPAEDLGNFRAHLLRDLLRGRISSERADAMWRHLSAGYGHHGGDWDLRTQLFTSIGCLRLATDPFRHREPEWATKIAQLIQLSIDTLAPILDAGAPVPCR